MKRFIYSIETPTSMQYLEALSVLASFHYHNEQKYHQGRVSLLIYSTLNTKDAYPGSSPSLSAPYIL